MRALLWPDGLDRDARLNHADALHRIYNAAAAFVDQPKTWDAIDAVATSIIAGGGLLKRAGIVAALKKVGLTTPDDPIEETVIPLHTILSTG